MADLEALRPIGSRRVFDLVREAGIDVSDWSKYAGGAVRAASNPRYCYEWSFVEPHKVVVLNIWHRGIRERRGTVTLKDNLRASAETHAQQRQGGSRVWQRRATRFDDAVATAASERLPVRAVICDGLMRRQREGRASKVKARMLDPLPWAVTSYNWETGGFTLTRGALPDRLVDQFTVGLPPDTPTEMRDVAGKVYVRDAQVRLAALRRAAGRCEWCREPGFTTAAGEVFLETHHVVPLGEEGRDTLLNVAALYPNHHREAHYGAARMVIRERLLSIINEGERRKRRI